MDQPTLERSVAAYDAKHDLERQLAGLKARLAEVALDKGVPTDNNIETKYTTPEQATAAMQEFGEALFTAPPRAYGTKMYFGYDGLLDTENMRRLSWRHTDYPQVPWHCVVVERIPLDDGSFKYRLLKPDSGNGSTNGILTSVPEKYEVLADSHDMVSDGSEEHTYDDQHAQKVKLDSLRSSAETFETVCEIAAWGSVVNSITDLVAGIKATP